MSSKTIAWVLVLLGVLVYASTLWNGMFWDDNDFILQNQYVREFAVDKFFSENVIAGAGFVSNYWRPALLTVFSLEWQAFHNFAAGYHFVNMAIHIADGVLLFFILLRLFGRKSLAFAAAAVFLVHPVATEAVSYANSLGDSLSVLFMFSGILLFLKGRRLWPLIFYALALMSKETAIIMPALLFLVSLPWRGEGLRERSLNALQKVWPYLVIVALYILLRATALNFQNTFNLYNEQNVFTQSVWVRVLTFFRILTEYFGLMFWPSHLHMERSVELATGIGQWDVILGGLIFFGLLSSAMLVVKKLPVISFALLWFLIGVAPTSNIAVPINGLLYEHWLYLPLIGIFLALIYLGIEAAERFPKIKPILIGTFCLLLAGFSIRAIIRNTDWHDPIRFYNQTLAYAPGSYRVWNNLGMAYMDAKEIDQAENSYKKAIALIPDNPVALYNLGNLYRDTGRPDMAAQYYLESHAADPEFIFSQKALLNLYLTEKKYAEAQKFIEVEFPENLEKYLSLAQLADAQKDYMGTLKFIERVLEIDPGNPTAQGMYFEIKNKIR